MKFDARKIINSPLGLNIAFLLGKLTPYWLGHRIAIFIADRISSHKDWKLVRITRCNQWVVHGCEPSGAELDKLVKQNFRNIATSIFDYYHSSNNPGVAIELVEPHPMARYFIQRPEFSERGLVIAGMHISNFEMAFQLSGLSSAKGLGITLSGFNAAYQKQHEARRKKGINVEPASFSSIKKAIGLLKLGGLVATAVDRPEEDSGYHPRFFGYPASLPIHHIFMALKANVPIMVAGIYKKSDGKYHFLFSEPIELERHPDRHFEIILNAEKILNVVEQYIRLDPCQWSMTFPVWPELLDQVPV